MRKAIGVFLVSLAVASAGERVWRDLDQSALDAAYNQSVYAPNLEQVLGRLAANSEVARQHLGPPATHAYGDGPDETLDVYATGQSDAPIFVFIHGGAWRLGRAADNAHAAELFVNAGIHYVVPDFSPVQTFDGDLRPMVAQLRAALIWIHQHAARTFGGNPDRIYLGGFSSGGHLAAVLLTTDWTRYSGTPADLIKGGFLCSGMYDLEPVALSSRREYVEFTPEVVDALSPQRHLDRINAPLTIAYGTWETPEFQRQARDFTATLQAGGHPVTLLVGEGYNHFEMNETFGNPYGLLGRAALAGILAAP